MLKDTWTWGQTETQLTQDGHHGNSQNVSNSWVDKMLNNFPSKHKKPGDHWAVVMDSSG